MNVIRCTRRLSTTVFRLSQIVEQRLPLSVSPMIFNTKSLASTSVLASKTVAAQANIFQTLQCRRYSHGVEMNRHMLTERIMLVLRLFDKVNPEKLTLESQFTKDLGLDSLDHVELIMAVEDEFGFEIPDQDAERLRCPGDVVQYLCDKLDVFE